MHDIDTSISKARLEPMYGTSEHSDLVLFKMLAPYGDNDMLTTDLFLLPTLLQDISYYEESEMQFWHPRYTITFRDDTFNILSQNVSQNGKYDFMQ